MNQVFNQLTSLGSAGRLHYLWQSPFTLHQRVIEAIRREAALAREGKPARIIAKMNALLEPETIEALYDASQAGVKIDLIVRGVCALRPGVEGLSENIKVRSIIGRFLEHHRVFYFRADGADDVYLSSADWMDRNFFRRIELCFPVLDKKLKARVIREGLQAYLADNVQAWEMDAGRRLRAQDPGQDRGTRRRKSCSRCWPARTAPDTAPPQARSPRASPTARRAHRGGSAVRTASRSAPSAAGRRDPQC